jgi:lipoprotein-releasing system permease protein
LANRLGVKAGDSVTLIAPQGTVTPAGIVPRLRQFTVSGVFKASMYEFDQGMALIHLEDAQKLYRMDNLVNGIRLKLDDLMLAPKVSLDLQEQLKGFYFVVDWSKLNESFFRAIQIEKNVMFIILTLIVAVAAFNIVSTLVMTVTDKRSDIAILQTLGATSASIRRIFMLLGLITGTIGIIAGVFFGVLVAVNIDVIVPTIESVFGVHFLDASVYAITELPSELHLSDVLSIIVISFILCLLSTILPSWQASVIRPAEALRYE